MNDSKKEIRLYVYELTGRIMSFEDAWKILVKYEKKVKKQKKLK